MKKILSVSLLCLIPAIAHAEDTTVPELQLNIRRIGFELSKTDVNNAADYSDSPVQQLKANSQDFIKAVSDIALEYAKDNFTWNNSLFMEYGRTTLKPYDADKTVDENADKILLGSDFSYKCWESYGFKFGPTARGQYQTEFTANGDVPRQNTVRANGGLSLFDHAVVKDLYITGVYEYDFTYSNHKTSKLAAELGWRLEYGLRDGVKLSTNGYYREYLDYSQYVGTDLRRDLSARANMDVNIWGDLTMGPYVQYRLAKSRDADVYGSNFVIGISFSYINKFLLK